MTIHAPPACPAFSMPLAKFLVRPVVRSTLFRGELEQGRPVSCAVQQGLAAPPAWLTCLHLRPAHVGAFAVPPLPPLFCAAILFLCYLRRAPCAQQRLLLALLISYLSQ
jgi:hypothetical protein